MGIFTPSMNQVNFSGRIGRTPQLRTVSGKEVLSFSVACNMRYKTNGEQRQDTTWMNVQIWMPNRFLTDLGPGDVVLIEGGQLKTYKTKDGQTRVFISVGGGGRVHALATRGKEGKDSRPYDDVPEDVDDTFDEPDGDVPF